MEKDIKTLEKIIGIINKLGENPEWADDKHAVNWEAVALKSDSNDFPIINYEGEEYCLTVEDYYVGEDEEDPKTHVVFSFEQFPNRYWQVEGKYDSWGYSGNEWDKPEKIHEVRQEAVISIVYRRV